MLDFVARAFRSWMNVLLWLVLIGCVIGGFIAGGNLLGGRGFSGGYAFLGLLIGTLIGLITIILSGGLIANFLNMVDNIESIEKNTRSSSAGSSSSGSSAAESSSGINLSNTAPISPTVVNYGDSWVCKKCGERNPNISSSCKGCGVYK